MRFLKGGGCPATPTLTPRACNPEPLRGHERLRGKQDGFVDEGGGLVSSRGSPSPPLLLFSSTAAPELHRYLSTPHKKRDGKEALKPYRNAFINCLFFSPLTPLRHHI